MTITKDFYLLQVWHLKCDHNKRGDYINRDYINRLSLLSLAKQARLDSFCEITGYLF